MVCKNKRHNQAQSKWVQRHMTDKQLKVAACSITKREVRLRVESGAKSVFPAFAMKTVTFVGSEIEWGSDIFSSQFYISLPGYSDLSITPFGVGEVRCLFGGEELIFGVPAPLWQTIFPR